MDAKEIRQTLQELIDNGTLNEAVQDAQNDMKKTNILKKHPYNIWLGEDGRWTTKIKKKNKLVPLRKKKYDDLLEALVDYYDEEKKPNTLTGMYPEWLEYKAKETSNRNASKLQWVWDKYYKGSDIAKKRLETLTTKSVKLWLLDVTEQQQLSSRQFKEVKSEINMMLDYAVEEGFIQHNVAREVRNISSRHFTEPEEKDFDDLAFGQETAKEVVEMCLEHFDKTGNPAALAICLNFGLGLRVGELVALKWSDFNLMTHTVRIRREEVQNTYFGEDGKLHRNGYVIVNHTKTASGKRELPLTDEVEFILKEIRKDNMRRGVNSEWLLIGLRGQRITKDGINNVLRRINKKLQITQKANHCIRRTVITDLFQYGLSDEAVRKYAGHKSSSTTHKYYECFDLSRKEKNREEYAQALNMGELLKVAPSGTR